MTTKLRVPEVAKQLGITEGRVYKYIHKYHIDKVDGEYRLGKASINRLKRESVGFKRRGPHKEKTPEVMHIGSTQDVVKVTPGWLDPKTGANGEYFKELEREQSLVERFVHFIMSHIR
jgi:hypothetical protein